jgi:hypothetical protein
MRSLELRASGCVQMKLFQKQEQDKQRAMDMLQGSFDMQLAVLRNLQAKRAGVPQCTELRATGPAMPPSAVSSAPKASGGVGPAVGCRDLQRTKCGTVLTRANCIGLAVKECGRSE